MSTTFTTPSSASTSIYKDALLRLDPISPSTWPEWLEALPYCVGGISGVAGVEFYLEGDLSKPPYDRTTMAAVLAESSRAAEYTRWTKVAEVLKVSVKLYGGAEAAARVDGLETKYGDAPNIWASLKEWYGHLETGAERGVLYADISNERWSEADESPAVYFQRLATKVARYNAAAKADALLSPDQSDPNWRGGLCTDSKKTVRFLIPRGTCFACFKEGHLVGNCPDKDDDEKLAKSRVEELKKDGIDVPLSDANALVIVDLANEGRPPLEEPVMQALATFALEGLDNLSA
ncbi:hypothetical protein JCM11641_001193, partial [Rhodosporidiobolus odoratus]